MTVRASEALIVGTGMAYLALLGWSVGNLSFDIWGALVVIPIYGLASIVILHRMFSGPLSPVAKILSWGLAIKFFGAAARYWVGFDAYGGAIDANRYHYYAIHRVSDVWDGTESFGALVPTGIGTEFLEDFTALVYAFTGGSKLAGFMTFAMMAYWGVAFMMKAAAIAIPGLMARRYAWFLVVFPSLVYWPSSIGKEAPMMLGLGVASYGAARLFNTRRSITGLFPIVLGLGFAALIRPHIAAIWMAAIMVSLVVGVFGRRQPATHSTKARSRLGMFLLLAPAVIAFSITAGVTIRYLEPDSGDGVETSSITQILDETTRRTVQAGSSFTPPSLGNPITWPYAAVRTLTRPLPIEARGIAQLFTAAEVTALLALYALSWRRVMSAGRLVISNPYVAYAVSAFMLSGLAYSSFANLGVLARQKSLVMPMLLLIPCLPIVARRSRDDPKTLPMSERHASETQHVQTASQ